jgi:hypothetical protein
MTSASGALRFRAARVVVERLETNRRVSGVSDTGPAERDGTSLWQPVPQASALERHHEPLIDDPSPLATH